MGAAPRDLRRAVAAVIGAIVAVSVPLAAGAAVTPWRASGPGTATVTNNGTTGPAQMTYSLQSTDVYSGQTWTFATVAPGGPRTLWYDYKGFHGNFGATAFVDFYVIHDGATHTGRLVDSGPSNCCAAPAGGFEFKGSSTLGVKPGDTYGFQVGGSNTDPDDALSGTLTVRTIVTSQDQCMDGGWKAVSDWSGGGFKSQGDCLSYVETGTRNPAAP